MAERSSYPPGTPNWVDVAVPDVESAARFYSQLFGWTHESYGPEAGGYGRFTLRGKTVAGIGPQMNPGPPAWSVYVSVSDVDKVAEAVKAHGGQVVVGPMDVMQAGRMAVAQDPGGAFFSLWQPLGTQGVELVNEPGAFTWNELAAGDLPKARDFYTAVLGWGFDPENNTDQAAIFTVDGNVVCGAHAAGPGEPPFWSVWFSVADCDASAAQATELGGNVVMPPSDMDFGRGAVVTDPAGAAFGIGAVNETAPGASG